MTFFYEQPTLFDSFFSSPFFIDREDFGFSNPFFVIPRSRYAPRYYNDDDQVACCCPSCKERLYEEEMRKYKSNTKRKNKRRIRSPKREYNVDKTPVQSTESVIPQEEPMQIEIKEPKNVEKCNVPVEEKIENNEQVIENIENKEQVEENIEKQEPVKENNENKETVEERESESEEEVDSMEENEPIEEKIDPLQDLSAKYKIYKIKEFVDQTREKVNALVKEGKKAPVKQMIMHEELLVQKMLELDAIRGSEEVRKQRKEQIIAIQKILESIDAWKLL